jgi:hypothetical protein
MYRFSGDENERPLGTTFVTSSAPSYRREVPHSLSSAQKVARVEASKELLTILQESETNHFDGITTGDESWLQYLYASLKRCARSPPDVVPRTRQGLGTTTTMITLFFTGRKLIVLDVLPKSRKYNQLYFVHHIYSQITAVLEQNFCQ